MSYKIFEDDDTGYECRKASVAAAEEYARFIVKCAPKKMQDRLEIASLFGWDASEVKDEINFGDYQTGRARLLFPALSARIDKEHASLFVPEVDRAEQNFMTASGIATTGPALSLEDLSAFLTQLVQSTEQVTVSQTPSSET